MLEDTATADVNYPVGAAKTATTSTAANNADNNPEAASNSDDEEGEWWEDFFLGILGLIVGFGLLYVLVVYCLVPMLNFIIFALVGQLIEII